MLGVGPCTHANRHGGVRALHLGFQTPSNPPAFPTPATQSPHPTHSCSPTKLAARAATRASTAIADASAKVGPRKTRPSPTNWSATFKMVLTCRAGRERDTPTQELRLFLEQCVCGGGGARGPCSRPADPRRLLCYVHSN